MQNRSFKSDFLQSAPELKPFSGETVFSADIDALVNRRKTVPVDRATLVRVLRRQNAQLPANEAMMKSIALLEKETTFTVTTGHQLCLLGGPMFTLHKITTAIRLAEEYKKRAPQQDFVPVFWMASEDHDFEEVNHFFSGFGSRHSYPGAFAGAVGRHIITDEIISALPAFVPEEIKKMYAPGRTWVQAFRELIHYFFRDYGLVIIDGDDAELKKCFAPVMKRELESQSVYHSVTGTDGRFREAGYEPQAKVREVNLFYLTDEARLRIVPTPDGFTFGENGKLISQHDLLAELESHPERFSPNVMTRPLYECTLLPDVVYVGGWAEMNYWSQLHDTFVEAGIPAPALCPRMSAGLLTSADRSQWESLGLSVNQLGNEFHLIENEIAGRLWDHSPLEESHKRINAELEQLGAVLGGLEPTLSRNINNPRAKMDQYFIHTRKKIRRILRNKYASVFNSASAIKNKVQPDGFIQERVLNFLAFGEMPVHALIAQLHAHCDPFHYEEKWITLP